MWLINILVGYYRQAVDATKEFFIRILMSILIFLGYVLLSLFIYAVMRRIMVPQKLHVLPVHLQYNSVCTSQSGPSDVSSCPFPQADVLLNNGKKLLRSGQYYKIALEMEVPENQLNLDAGLFMVNITFYSTNKQFLSTSSRPAAVRYKSDLLQVMYTIVFSAPLLLGIWEQKQILELVLFESYYEPYGDGALSAKIFLESNRVHVYSTILTIDADFSGFTYYLYQWPLSMSIIVVISILITLCTCTVLLWIRDVLQDYEERRAMGLQRRRGMMQQRGGAGRDRTEEHRGMRQLRPHRNAETVGATSTTVPRSDSIPGPPPPPSAAGTHFERVGDDSDERTEGQSSGTVTPTDDTREGSEIRDTTESESSAGFGDAIINLQSMRQQLENEASSDTSSMEEPIHHERRRERATGDGGDVTSSPGMETLRHRT